MNRENQHHDGLPKPNIIPLQRTPGPDEPPVPSYLADGSYEELGSSEVNWEWDPIEAWEKVEGYLESKISMRLGGTCYTLAVLTGEKGEDARHLLLKKGGRIFESCMRNVEIGDRLLIRYAGLLPAKPGLNPARDWRVYRRKNP